MQMIVNISALRVVIAMMTSVTVVASGLALDVILWNIAIDRARLRIGQPTRRHVMNVLLNCLIRHYSSSLRQMKIALSAIYDFQSMQVKAWGIGEKDKRKATYSKQLAAMAANVKASGDLGCDKHIAGN
eukprot:scaffold1592_cov137-Chaetoceros_neogracile.AAC.1